MTRTSPSRRRLAGTDTAVIIWAVVIALSTPAAIIDSSPEVAERVVLARPSGLDNQPPGVAQLQVDSEAYHRLRSLGSVIVGDFPLPGRSAVELKLTAFSPLTPAARFVVVDESGARDVPRPDVRFYRGVVAGDVDSLVTLGLFEGRIAGFVRAFGEEFGFGPREYNLEREGSSEISVWNRQLTETPPADPVCQGDFEPEIEPRLHMDGGVAPRSVDPATALSARVAVDATLEWYNRFGSLSAAQNYILNLMAQVSTIYENEINLQLQIPYLRVFAAEPDPYTNGTTSTSQLLADVRAEWNAHQTGVSRSMVHLFSYRSSGGAGVAYLDVLCSNMTQPGSSYDYGVSTLSASGGAWERELVAHEIGHNIASPHTHCYAPEIDRCANQSGCFSGTVVQSVGTIMSYCSQTSPVFHQRVRDVLRPAVEDAYPACISIAGGPGSLRTEGGNGLTLRKMGGGSLRLEWGAPCNAAAVPAQDFAVYRGSIGNFTSYSSLACSTDGASTYLAAGTPNNSFFLVVPQTATDEGSYGLTSWGTERPPAAAACRAQDIGPCTP